MKFNEAKENASEISKKEIVSKSKKFEDADNITSISIYDNIAVYLMKPGTKGNFKYISTLANNGKESISWSIRIYYTGGKWSAQVASHPDIESLDNSINMSEILSKYEGIDKLEYFSNLHVGTARSEEESYIEDVVNYFIDQLKDKRLKGIENQEINKKFTRGYSKEKYKIIYHLGKIKNVESSGKYSEIRKILLGKQIEEKEIQLINSVDVSNLTISDKESLFSLSQKYLTEPERIKIAMKYLDK